MIPVEAVEAAAKALSESIGNAVGIWEMHSWATQDAYLKHARAALEAAAPHMLSEAWDEGAAAGAINERADYRGEEPEITNPYRTTK